MYVSPAAPYGAARYLGCVLYSAQEIFGAVTDDPRIGGDSGHIHINHSFYHQLRTEKYALDHPEYYAMLRPEYEGRKGGAGRQP